jgi:preprotein translocase subunit YajC
MLLNSFDLFLATAPAPAQPQAWTMLPMLLLMVLMIGFMFYSQSKKAKQHAQLLTTLKPGDKVLTSSGIIGVIVTVRDKAITLRSADAKLELTKSAVADIIERGAE